MKSTKEQHLLFPNAGQAFLLYVALFLVEYLVGTLLHDAQGLLALQPAQAMVLITVLGNGLLVSSVMHWKVLDYRTLIHPRSGLDNATLAQVILATVLLVPALLLLLNLVLEVVVYFLPMSDAEKSMFSMFQLDSLAMLLAICVVAPVVEEILFRGLILRSFLRQYPLPLAIGYSALLFGFAHLNMYQFIVAFLIGCLSGWLYARSKSLLPCIALHGAYNTLTYLIWINASDMDPEQGLEAPLEVWVLACAMALGAVVWLRKLLQTSASQQQA